MLLLSFIIVTSPRAVGGCQLRDLKAEQGVRAQKVQMLTRGSGVKRGRTESRVNTQLVRSVPCAALSFVSTSNKKKPCQMNAHIAQAVPFFLMCKDNRWYAPFILSGDAFICICIHLNDLLRTHMQYSSPGVKEREEQLAHL